MALEVDLMANNPVYVYDHACTNFDNTGLVGDVRPISALFSEEKNGLSQVTLRLSYDQYGKWKKCKVGNILKVLVPVRLPPVISNDEYANTTESYG